MPHFQAKINDWKLNDRWTMRRTKDQCLSSKLGSMSTGRATVLKLGKRCLHAIPITRRLAIKNTVLIVKIPLLVFHVKYCAEILLAHC